MDRRAFLYGATAGLTGLSLKPTITLAAPNSHVRPALFEKAKAALDMHRKHVQHTDIIGIADFASHSSKRRFHLVDLLNGKTTSLLVSHGKGSDPRHTGWLRHFSNVPGSEATSGGSYLMGRPYVGKHGQSQRLIGLDPHNDLAEKRAIVVHGAWYVNHDMVKKHGKIGRSQGCFAFAENDLKLVLDRLGPGRLLFADKA